MKCHVNEVLKDCWVLRVQIASPVHKISAALQLQGLMGIWGQGAFIPKAAHREQHSTQYLRRISGLAAIPIMKYADL